MVNVIVTLWRVAVSKDRSYQWVPTFFCVSFLFIFLQLIVTCRLWVIYVREYNDSNVKGHGYTVYVEYIHIAVRCPRKGVKLHYNDVIMGAMASQSTSITIVYSTVYSVADQRKHQSSASLAFVRVIHRWPVNSPHKGPVTQKMFPFDDVIM